MIRFSDFWISLLLLLLLLLVYKKLLIKPYFNKKYIYLPTCSSWLSEFDCVVGTRFVACHYRFLFINFTFSIPKLIGNLIYVFSFFTESIKLIRCAINKALYSTICSWVVLSCKSRASCLWSEPKNFVSRFKTRFIL